MGKSVKFRTGKVFSAVLVSGFIALTALQASAAPVEGCDQRVLNAMNAKAQAKVAYDVAVTEEIIRKPDSVLAMTCFNKSANTSAKKGGEIFSGDFTSFLEPIISDALAAFYDDFGGAPSQDFPWSKVDGSTNYYDTATTELPSTVDSSCDGIKNLWEKIEGAGVTGGVPNVTMEELMDSQTIPPDAGGSFESNWKASQTVFDELKDAMALVPKPLSVPDYSADKTVCEVLTTLKNGTKPQGC